MAAVLPFWPRIVMCYIEPVTLLAGTIAPLISPTFFVPSQLPASKLPIVVTPSAQYPLLHTEHILALQLSNLYFLMFLVGVFILRRTTEPPVVHGYVWALWIADIGHVGATAYVMGWDGLTDIAGWNATMWGNIGITTALFAVRSLYLAGMLGTDTVPARRRLGTKKAQ